MRILFTGYAPVHFLCFRPLFDRLVTLPDVEVAVSGGLRTITETETRFDGPGMYGPLGVDPDRVLPMDAMREMDFDIVFAGNTKMLLPRSVEVKVQVFHGVSFRNRAIRSANMGCDYFFLAGPYMRRKFAEAELLSEDARAGLSVGFMKTDALLDGSLDRAKLLAEHGFDGNRPVVAYCPTGQRDNSLETMGEDVLRRLVEEDAYDILVKLHDHPHGDPVDWPARLAPLENGHLKIVRTLDVIPVLYLADLLITDASSVSSEYSLLDRPMVFLDVPELIARAAGKDESMLDDSTWGRRGGSIVVRPEDAAKTVSESLADPDRHGEIRRSMAADLFYNPGRSVPTAMEWLRDQFGLPLP